jgi:hypothetical protein
MENTPNEMFEALATFVRSLFEPLLSLLSYFFS